MPGGSFVCCLGLLSCRRSASRFVSFAFSQDLAPSGLGNAFPAARVYRYGGVAVALVTLVPLPVAVGARWHRTLDRRECDLGHAGRVEHLVERTEAFEETNIQVESLQKAAAVVEKELGSVDIAFDLT